MQDIFDLPYADGSFDVIIASNVLHIIPEPEKALAEIKRVMSKDGILIAPTFTHAKMGIFGKIKAGAMKLFGFPLHSKWSPDDYLEFLKKNGLAADPPAATVCIPMKAVSAIPSGRARCGKMRPCRLPKSCAKHLSALIAKAGSRKHRRI